MICFALHGGITGRNGLKFKKRFAFLPQTAAMPAADRGRPRIV
jgi:hypothetical protein